MSRSDSFAECAAVDEHVTEKTIHSFFNAVSCRYDLINSVLSFGGDAGWRRHLIRMAIEGDEESVLDLGAGTGASLGSLLKRKTFRLAVGCDASSRMLSAANQKLGAGASLIHCDFGALPFADHSFDLVTGSFILRSVRDRSFFFRETYRMVKAGGTAAFLELTKPANALFYKWFYRPYLRTVVTRIGGWISGNRGAYEFLSNSIQSFVTGRDLKGELEKAGFRDIVLHELNVGTVSVLTAKKGER